MTLAEDIRSRLEQAFTPSELQVIDDSERHRGHAGYQEGGESHWHIVIAASALDDMGRVARHRAIHEAIGRDILDRIHALSIDIR